MRLGVDLGGTKIEAVLLDANGAILKRKRVATPHGNYDRTIAAVKALVEETGNDAPDDLPVGIGIPGAISPATGLIKNANSTWLIGKPFDRDLERAMSRPVRLANDADCFTLSEATDGAGAGAATVFGVILGTGVGGGFVMNQNLLSGPNAIAGEWGHNPLPWATPEEQPGTTCYCGRKGCIETWLSGPALEKIADAGGLKEKRAREIASLAEADNPQAVAFLESYLNRLARALASVINILDPETIVLGGGLSAIDAIYTRVPKIWGDFVFSDTVATKLCRNRHGDSSGVRGAAWLWPDGKVTGTQRQ